MTPNREPMQNANSDKKDDPHFLIVGIGASAGGVKALTDFFSNVPSDSGMAYVVILHLSPDFDSKLAQILQLNCAIPVSQVQIEKALVEPNHVYVIAPNHSLSMLDGFVALSARETFEERRAPVDIFFRTLADSNSVRAVAVVLSGTGSDGSMGIRRIKEEGGIVIVQEPDEAEYGDMPRNSIAQGLVDLILPVKEIPGKIIQYRNQRTNIHIKVKDELESKEEVQENALGEIFAQLRSKTGHDFSNYKRPTLLRRIERRMGVRQTEQLVQYAEIVKTDHNEPQILLKDLLIPVTNFFRDKSAFEPLESDIVPKIFTGKKSNDIIRIWVAACATGEEAYSIAMLCAERLGGIAAPPVVQIFATDIDHGVLNTARDGLYSNADVADVSPERLRKFFQKEGNGFRVRRELRDTILFARHNILRDPPFSRLDMASCRNLLIYLNRPAQDRVLNTLHFALHPGAYLFLGSSETIDGNNNLYAIINREHCIFQARSVLSRPQISIPEPSVFNRTDQSDLSSTDNEHRSNERFSSAGLHQSLLELYAPPSILVNSQHEIIHVSKTAGHYLQIKGEPSLNLLNIVRPELRLELRTALHSAAQSGSVVHVANLSINNNTTDENIEITVRPVLSESEAGKGFLLIFFESKRGGLKAEAQPIVLNASNEPIAVHLEEQLIHARAQFRQLSEQYEVQTEEFKASNEELQAINEELRSAAEELETSKEELQSVNEELATVNQELKVNIEELSHTNNDFRNLINATDIGTIFLDRTYSINLFTPAACNIFNLKAADYGRPLSDITSKLSDINIMADVRHVLASLQAMEREVKTTDNKTFLMRLLPYRTEEDHINGVIITFVDISERVGAEHALRNSEEKIRAMFTQARAGVAQADFNGRITMVNARCCQMLDFDEHELLHKNIQELLMPEEGDKNLLLMEQLAKDGKPFDEEQRYQKKDRSFIWLHNSASRIHDQQGSPHAFLFIFIDITHQKTNELQKDEFLAIASHELKTPMTSIKGYTELLLSQFNKDAEDQVSQIIYKLNNQANRMVGLISELLDTSRIASGLFTMDKQAFDPNELIKELVELWKVSVPKHNFQLHLETTGLINADRERIRQVIGNFIDNAVKYAPDSTEIIITSHKYENTLKICVKDFGDGIDDESMQNIFNRFYRANSIQTMNSLGFRLIYIQRNC